MYRPNLRWIYLVNMNIESISRMHIDSFDYSMSEGLLHLCERLQPCEIEFPDLFGIKLYKFWIEYLHLGQPYKTTPIEGVMKEPRLFPTECRLRELSYTAPLIASVARQVDSSIIERFKVNLGAFPIMVKSEFCHLSKMSSEESYHYGEDIQELGGYFIINGVEKLVRLLIMQKQNYPLAILRPAFTNRGNLYTALAVTIRCVRDDLHTQSVTLHYLSDGTCTVRFILRRGEIFVPAIILLKCFKDASDQDFYHKLVRGSYTASQTYSRVEILLRETSRYAVYTREQALVFLGDKCRTIINPPSYMSLQQIGQLVVNEHVFVHLDHDDHKFELLAHMIEKLYALAEGDMAPENADVLSSQEFLLPGHLSLNFIKEKLEDTMDAVKARFLKECKNPANKIRDLSYLQKVLEQHAGIGKKMEYLLATGNLISRTGLDLMQSTGFAIIADRINYSRYTSHFQSVHRGAYFTEMKISSVRKLHPESWGFLCPVHTPDGAPCGLLNHLASRCKPFGKPAEFTEKDFREAVQGMDYETLDGEIKILPKEFVPLFLNGRIIGYSNCPDELEPKLRLLKIQGKLPKTLEIAFLPKKPFFPGIYMFCGEGRLLRQVIHVGTGKKEWIGPLEQLNLKIACLSTDIVPNTTHKEITPLSLLSLLACCIPFSDHNQSPRNMYQCQMAKQTMGTAIYNYPFRADNKIYRLTTPQRPLVTSRCKQVRNFGFEQYPSGINAVVAVISYTGYDMEDAMIINKSAYERGLGHGYVYKTKFKEISSKEAKFELIGREFGAESTSKGLDIDGLPFTGSAVSSGTPEMLLFSKEKESTKLFMYKDLESACFDDIKLIGTEEKDYKVSVKYRLLRNPIIGDKFSSRHGQKGVLSILWPQEDMPFTEQGITPDIIINPHAFPSRMTIGMLIESMAGKSGSMLGRFQEASAFQGVDKLEEFGTQLTKLGYNYYGSERMYSGIFGNEMTADIYLGVVYYQRLRHMVSDKYQARSTGPVDILTQQPVKGRKKHGGIRLGEMERDSLLAHGGAFMLHDRLLKCSDYSEGFACQKCGSILTAFLKKDTEAAICYVCGVPAQKVSLPYVLRYLTNELAAMNIKLKFRITDS